MPKGFYKELTAILERYGCSFHRQGKGDHEIWFSPINNQKFSIDKITYSKKLANRCLKAAGIDEKI